MTYLDSLKLEKKTSEYHRLGSGLCVQGCELRRVGERFKRFTISKIERF